MNGLFFLFLERLLHLFLFLLNIFFLFRYVLTLFYSRFTVSVLFLHNLYFFGCFCLEYSGPLKKKKKKKLKKWKKYYSEKTPTNSSWPMCAKSDTNIFYSKRKKTTTQNYHGLWEPNMILNHQALYITK